MIVQSIPARGAAIAAVLRATRRWLFGFEFWLMQSPLYVLYAAKSGEN